MHALLDENELNLSVNKRADYKKEKQKFQRKVLQNKLLKMKYSEIFWQFSQISDSPNI